MRKLVVSTGNKNKLKEIRELLADYDLEVLSKKDLGLEDLEVEEDGSSLSENSRLKAESLAQALNYKYMVMADDSGLFVEALDFRPGVYSSRYAGDEGNDKANNNKLLRELEGLDISRRSAYFKAVITLIKEDGQLLELEGKCSGHIALVEKGKNGFGYDPLFIPEGYDKSFAELDESVKKEISHRSRALAKLKKVMPK